MQFTANKKNILKLNGGFIFVIVIFFAIFLRTYKLDIRPMHTDEAVHAVKFGELLENDSYKYDPVEYHGPTLNYFTLLSASLFGEETLQEINETTLRLVPAIISLLLIASLILIYQKNNFGLIILIAFVFAISPVLQFYSRYYIQEVLLVTFTYSGILTFYKYFSTKKLLWLVISGVIVSLIFATKETSIITFFAGTTTIIALSGIRKDFRKRIQISKSHLVLFSLTAIFISILFYSSFFTNLKGISDSILTFENYFSKAGENLDHAQPWYYYVQLIFFSNNKLIFYSGVPIFIFCVIGIYFLILRRKEIQNILFFEFIAIFSFTQAVIYSFISYKTPWLVLNFWVGFLFLAGLGIYQAYNFLNNKSYKILFTILVALVFSHNIYQTYISSFKYSYQQENPFTYSQPTQQVIEIANKVISVAESNSDAYRIFVNVIARDNDYWPLPWYLRKMKNVAWNNNVPENIYKFPIVLATPQFEDELIEKLYSTPPPGEKHLYVPLLEKQLTIRPNVEVRGYVQKKYYDFYLRSFNETLKK